MMVARKVLIVDDSESMRQILRRVLETVGVHVLEGAKAKEGMEILLQEPVDLLITDWNMLEMDGLEFTRVLRSLSAFERLPILMLSNQDTDANRVEAMLAGVDSFVSKCATFEVLREEVLGLLEGQASTSESRARRKTARRTMPEAASALLLGFTGESVQEVRDQLSRLGYRAFTARDPWESLACLQQTVGVELLVVEWAELRPDYLNMILQIQQDPRWKDIRVLVLNSPWTPPPATGSGRADAHGFLRVGCSLDELRGALRSMGLSPKDDTPTQK